VHPTTPAYDLQRACGISLSAIVQLGCRIALGEIDCAIGGGVDSTSDIPLARRKETATLYMLDDARSPG
jgi:acetyl-CoA C-acetyltransferase